MATVTAVRPAVRGWTTRPRLFGWALLACWSIFLVVVLFALPRDSTLTDLRSGIASGDVDTIRVEGGLGPAPGHHGFAELTIQWREGLFRRSVVLREARPIDSEARDTDLDVVEAGVVERLQAAFPDLRVERGEPDYPSFSSEVLGREATGGLAWTGVTLILMTFALLIGGPEPWRATRWAWFWLFWLALPLGPVGYLLLGGPTGVGCEPRPGARRLTGGWSFLLMMIALGPISAALMSRL